MEFGVEKISDIIKTSELLSDEELRNELGMSAEASSLFRTLFLSEDEDDQARLVSHDYALVEGEQVFDYERASMS